MSTGVNRIPQLSPLTAEIANSRLSYRQADSTRYQRNDEEPRFSREPSSGPGKNFHIPHGYQKRKASQAQQQSHSHKPVTPMTENGLLPVFTERRFGEVKMGLMKKNFEAIMRP